MQTELVTTERIAIVILTLAQGHALTTADVAKLAELTPSGAWRLLDRASRAVPLAQVDGRWQLVTMPDGGGSGQLWAKTGN